MGNAMLNARELAFAANVPKPMVLAGLTGVCLESNQVAPQ
jgi:hypothetical protein